MGDVIIKCFQTPKQKYFYDRHLNSVVAVTEEEFDALQKIEQTGKISDMDVLKRFTDRGLLKKSVVEKIEHPDSVDLKYFSEHKISDLILQVTQQCNLRCKYCSYSGLYNNRTHSSERMDFALAKKAIDFYIKRSREAEKLCLSFYGGEPLLEYPLIQKCVSYILEIKGEQPIGFVITTNGTLLTKEKFEFFVKNKFSIMVSLDGEKESHDANRKFVSGIGSFNTIMENLNQLRKYDETYYRENVIFNCVISASTDIKKTYAFFSNEERFFDGTVNYNYVNTAGIKEDSITKIQQKNRREQDFEYLKMLLSLIGRRKWDNKARMLRPNADSIELLYAHLHRHEPEWGTMHHNGPCMPGIRRLFVNTKGVFYPCERVSENDSQMSIGSLNEGFDYDKMDFFMNHGKIIKEDCKKCWNLRECLFCLGSVEKQGDSITKEDLRKICVNSRESMKVRLCQVCALAENGYQGNQNLKMFK